MTLNAQEPTDQTTVKDQPGYQRETRAAVNELTAGLAGDVVTVATISAITAETLPAGSNVIQIRHMAVDGTVSFISGGSDGQIMKVKISVSQSVTFTHSASKANGSLFLSGAGNNLDAVAYDYLELVNIGGDPDTAALGYWAETVRTLWVP